MTKLIVNTTVRCILFTLLISARFYEIQTFHLFQHKTAVKKSYHVTRATNYDSNSVQFTCPLLDAGYLPAVIETEQKLSQLKPMLLYLPGFDGTLLSPFLQVSFHFDAR